MALTSLYMYNYHAKMDIVHNYIICNSFYFFVFCFQKKGPSRLGEPGPRLQQMMDSGKLNASSAGESMSLNASIRERLRSKVRGRQVS